MIQRGRATPERRTTTSASLNTEVQAMETFRRLMTDYLGRAPTAAEFEDERRRLAYQAFRDERGYSPLSPVPTPPPSPTSVVPDIVRIPMESEYSPLTSEDEEGVHRDVPTFRFA